MLLTRGGAAQAAFQKIMTELRLLAAQAVMTVRPFLSRQQLAVLAQACRGEEALHFLRRLVDLAEQIRAVPKTGDQEGLGDQSTVHLHYFLSSCDWFVVEKDAFGEGVDMAFGYTVLNGNELDAELGYVSISEIVHCGAELDLHFKPRSLAEVKAERANANHAEIFNPNPWVLVANPGEDHEDIIADFPGFAEATAAQKDAGEGDVMRRLDDGTLTTEF